MKVVSLRFYEELNDFLPSVKKKKRYQVGFTGTPSVKDFIESQGTPHPEIDLILVNGKSVSFSYKLKGGEDISVYPEFESFDLSRIQKLRPKPLRRPKFILDVHLGTLSKYLRMLGFDALYENDYSDNQIIEIAIGEKRAILTRDLGILKQSRVKRGYWVRSTKTLLQVEEVINRFQLQKEIKEFSRCVRCNNILKPIKKEKVLLSVPPRVKEAFNEYFYCRLCDKIYWKGSHFEKMSAFVEKLKDQLP